MSVKRISAAPCLPIRISSASNGMTTRRRLLTTNSQHDNYTKSSTFWLRDASYLRLKNIQLSYDFPQKWIAPLKIASLKVFVNAENLLTFSDFDIFDPERSLTSDYIWSYPSVKSFTGGINVTF